MKVVVVVVVVVVAVVVVVVVAVVVFVFGRGGESAVEIETFDVQCKHIRDAAKRLHLYVIYVNVSMY